MIVNLPLLYNLEFTVLVFIAPLTQLFFAFKKLTPAVTGAFVVSAANEKCVRVYGIVRHLLALIIWL